MSLDTEQQVAEAPDTGAGIAIPGEAAPTEQAQIGGHDDTETRARAMGWVPKEEFRGPEDKWRSAEEFVKRGEEDLPILRERNRDLSRKVASMEADFADKLSRLERMTATAIQRQRQDLEAQYEAALRSAAASGDVDRYDQLRRDKVQAVNHFDTQVHQQRQPQVQQQVAQAVDAWIASNPWYQRDRMLGSVAEQALTMFQNDPERVGVPLEENLKEVTRYVQGKFPEKFGITPRAPARPASVEGGGRMPTGSGVRAKGASDLPADVRRVGEKFVKEGLFKDLNAYARDYFAQD